MTLSGGVRIPDQTGRTALVTGANSGLGLRTATALAEAGARVWIACRDPERGRAALERIRRTARGEVDLLELDLGDLAAVRRAAERAREATGDRLDLLVNNAGVALAPRQTTKDGFEWHFGVNHLGPAAFTWLVMPALRARPGARVVAVSSLAHRFRNLDFDDLSFERRKYQNWRAYGVSKLANLLFAFELDRRAKAAGLDLTSVAAHPGTTHTEIGRNGLRLRWGESLARIVAAGGRAVTQSVEHGAEPLLYAATAPELRGGEYLGPGRLFETRGAPKAAYATPQSRDPALARRLWELTARLTGVAPDPA